LFGFSEVFLIKIALSPITIILKVFFILLLTHFNCFIIMTYCFWIILKSMITKAKTIKNTRIPIFTWFIIFFILSCFKIYNSFMIPLQMILTHWLFEVAFSKISILCQSGLIIVDRKLVIAHILVNISSCNINSLIILNFKDNFRKALKSFSELVYSMVH